VTSGRCPRSAPLAQPASESTNDGECSGQKCPGGCGSASCTWPTADRGDRPSWLPKLPCDSRTNAGTWKGRDSRRTLSAHGPPPHKGTGRRGCLRCPAAAHSQRGAGSTTYKRMKRRKTPVGGPSSAGRPPVVAVNGAPPQHRHTLEEGFLDILRDETEQETGQVSYAGRSTQFHRHAVSATHLYSLERPRHQTRVVRLPARSR